MAKKQKTPFRINGRVIDQQTRQGISGLRVEAWDKDLVFNDLVGGAVTGDNGVFQIVFDQCYFAEIFLDRRPDLFFKVFRGDALIKSTEDAVLWNVSNATTAIELEVDSSDKPDPGEPAFRVFGTVHDASGKPMPNLSVRAFVRGLRTPEPLGGEETNANGEYRIEFRLAAVRPGDALSRRAPWLIVEVRDTPDGKVLARQEVPKAARDQNISFTLANVGAVSEWQRIGEAVAPLLKGQPDLQFFDLNAADIDFISRETGLDANWLAHFVDAVAAPVLLDKSAPNSKASPSRKQMAEMLYGLLRAGPATSVEALISTPRRTLQASLEWAFERRIVSADAAKAAEALLDEWDRLRGARVAVYSPAGQPFSVRAVLEPLHAHVPAILSERVQRMAARDGMLHAGVIDELEKDPGLDDAGRKALPLLRTTVALATVVKGDVELLEAFVKTSSSLPTITQPEHIVRLAHADWLRVVEAIKPASGADEPVLSAAQRASTLMRQADATYLSEAAHLRVDSGELKLSPGATGRLASLANNHPTAKLGAGGEAAIAVALKQGATAGADLDTGDIELLNLDTMLKVCGSSLDVVDMQREGFGSVQEIVAIGRSGFVNAMLRDTGKERLTDWSEEAANSTYMKLVGAQDIGTIAMTGMVIKNAFPAPAALRANTTTLGGLTTNHAQCACEAGRSVLSQSAYLADLLNFLRDATRTGVRTPLDVLLDRRPDLQEVLLDCTNESTQLGYVDLVNEILERAVVSGKHHPDWLFLGLATPGAEFKSELNIAILPQILRADLAAAGVHLSSRAQVQVVTPGLRWRVKDERWVVDLFNRFELFGSSTPPGIRAAPWPQSSVADQAGDSLEPARVMAAYAVLAVAPFPWSLPFDYALRATRFILNARGVPEAELRAVFCNGSLSEAARDAAVARLQLPERVLEGLGWAVLLERHDAARWGFGGVNDEVDDPSPQYDGQSVRPKLRGWKMILTRLWFFMRKADLDFGEVQSLLETSFLNPNGDLRIKSTDYSDPSPCDIRKLYIDGPSNFPVFEQFIRFARACRLPFDELDVLFSAVGTGVWRADMVRIAVALSIRDRLGLGSSEAAALWAPISTRSYSNASSNQPTSRLSAYDRIFRSSAALMALLPADPANGSGWPTFEQLRAVLPDALSLESDGIDRWLTIAGLTAAQPSSLESLSALYRHTLLARALGASVAEYQQFCSLAGEPPFSTATPVDIEQVQRFADRWSACRSLSSSLAPIVYILRPNGPAHADLEAQAVAAGREVQARLSALWDQPAATRADEIARSLAKLAGVDQPGATFLGRSLVAPTDRALSDNPRRTVIEFLNDRQNWIGTSPIDRSSSLDTIDALVLVQKVGMLFQLLRVAREHWEWLLGHASAAGWLDVNALPTVAVHPAVPLESLDRLASWVHLANERRVPSAQMGLLFGAIASGNRASTHLVLSAILDIPVADIDALLGRENSAGAWNADFPADYWNPGIAMRLARAGAYSARLKVAPAVISAWFSTAGLGFAERVLRADGIRCALLASLDEANRRLVQAEYQKQVTHACRTALIGYLMHRHQFVDRGDLFAHYLIDVEMSVEQRSTRIAQAVLASQLFIQRSLMNLEPAVRLSELDAPEWGQWRKWYRVWEANRKVFLYPENWLEPEFRDDKSPAFAELESELQQSDLSSESATSAFGNYLEKLGQVSRLELVSILNSWDERRRRDVTHLFARTRSSPVTHYYRQRIKSLRWTAWEKVDADIDGDFLIPIVQGNRLQLIWAVVKEEAQAAGTATAGDAGTWKVQFARSRRTQAGWHPKEMLGQPFRQPRLPGKDASSSFAFRTASETNDNVRVLAFAMVEGARPDVPVPPGKLEIYPVVDSKLNTSSWPLTLDFVYKARPDIGVPNVTVRASVSAGSETDRLDFKAGSRVGQHICSVPPKGAIKISLTVEYYYGGFAWSFLLPAERRDPTGPNPGLSKYGAEGLQFHTGYYSGMTITILVNIIAPPQPNGPPLPLIWMNIPGIVCTPSGTVEPGVSDANAVLTIPENAVPSGMGYKPKTSALHLSFSRTSQSVIDTLSANTLLLGNTAHAGIGVTFGAHPNLGFDPIFGLSTADGAYIGDITQGGRYSDTTWVFSGRVRLESVHYPRDSALLSAWAQSQALCLPSAILQAAGTPADVSSSLRRLSNTSVAVDFVPEGIEFDHTRPSSIYNWEIFLHIPWMIATRLSENKRYSEAQRWLHTIFDPTVGPNGTASSPLDAWRCRPLRAALQQDETLLDILADQFRLSQQVEIWDEQPFQPHALARYRLRSYAIAVLKSYIENLIAWGDDIARRNTLEAVNEATQLYVLAASLLGERPGRSIQRPASESETFSLLTGFDLMSNPLASTHGANGVPRFQLRYFCIPPNEMLLDLWARVEAGLQRVRSGAVGSLFGPPIDPALLVRAAAQGLDMADIVAGLSEPSLPYRLTTTLQKASQFCGEVKALGNALLGALEKRDTEELSLLRARHDHALAAMQRDIRATQIREADAQIVTLRASRGGAVERLTHFQKLLNLTANPALAEGAKIARLELITALASGGSSDFDARQLGLSRKEMSHLEHSKQANDFALVASIISQYASIMHMLPNISSGPPFLSSSFGGSNIGQGLTAYSTVFQALSADQNYQANRSSTVGSHERRRDEWAYQHNTVAAEIEQIDRQIEAAKIRCEIAGAELAYQNAVSENALDIEQFLKSKFSSAQLYHWMVRQLSSSYFRAYQVALGLAKAAQTAFDRELAPERPSQFIKASYWDGLREGLLAGEQLALDLTRLEASYLKENTRELEITKHVSLAQLNPLQLIKLRITGSCTFTIPEVLLDLDYPDHYKRRIKSVSVSLPCVVGPYAGIAGTLRMTASKTRLTDRAQLLPDNPFLPDDRRRIAVSGGQGDSGLFETNLRDERYLPFEGAGVADSAWAFDLAREFPAFDRETISDLVMHIRYTALAGQSNRSTVLVSGLNAITGSEASEGMWRTFSLRHEFASAWQQMITSGGGDLTITWGHFGYFLRGRTLTFKEIKGAAFLRRSRTVGDIVDLDLAIPPGTTTRQLELTATPTDAAHDHVLNGSLTLPVAPQINQASRELKLHLALRSGGLHVPPADIEDIFLSMRLTL